MTRKLYEHERHPLDIAAEEEAKVLVKREETHQRLETKISNLTKDKLDKPLDDYSLRECEIIITFYYLGLDFFMTGNKLREKMGWPVSRQEMVQYLKDQNYAPPV